MLVLIADHMNAEREFIDIGPLAAKVEDADFGIRHTAVEARFGIWLTIALISLCSPPENRLIFLRV